MHYKRQQTRASATDRRSYVSEHRFTKFGEITHGNRHLSSFFTATTFADLQVLWQSCTVSCGFHWLQFFSLTGFRVVPLLLVFCASSLTSLTFTLYSRSTKSFVSQSCDFCCLILFLFQVQSVIHRTRTVLQLTSVCLSVKCVHCDKTNLLPTFLYHIKDRSS